MDALLAGIVLGVIHFGGLWWTLRRALGTTTPYVLVGASYIARTAITVGGFYLFMDGSWIRLVALGAGFTLARIGLGARLGLGAGPQPG